MSSEYYDAVELTQTGPALVQRRHGVPVDGAFVTVAPRYVGICGSDLKEVRGERIGRTDFGHELVGLVVESRGVDNLPNGSRVVLDPNVAISRGSGFAEYLTAVASPQKLTAAFPLVPTALSDERAIFCEPLAVAHHCVSRMKTHWLRSDIANCSISIFGAGTMAILMAWLIKAAGAKVVVCNRSGDRLQSIARMKLLAESEMALISSVSSSSYDAVILAAGQCPTQLVAAAFSAVRPSGLLQIFGGTRKGDGIDVLGLDLDTIRRGERCERVLKDGAPVIVGGSYGTDQSDFLASSHMLSHHPDSYPVEMLINLRTNLEKLPGLLPQLALSTSAGKTVVQINAEDS